MSAGPDAAPPHLITATIVGDTAHATDSRPVPWWSIAKSVLAAAALALVDQGRLALDTPLAPAPFTLRQLLQHRAGLPCYAALRAYHQAVAAAETPWPVADLRQRVRTLAPPARGTFAYSNIGYLHVRTLIERAADRPLAAALDHLVFHPLGIQDVTLAQTPADLAASAWGNPAGYHPLWVYHGLLLGPAISAALFLHRLLAGRLLSPASLAAMRTAMPVGGPVPGRPWQTANYGLGLMIGKGDSRADYIGHTGGGPGSTAAVYGLAVPPAGNLVRTAAAFAPAPTADPGSSPGDAETHAMRLAGTP